MFVPGGDGQAISGLWAAAGKMKEGREGGRDGSVGEGCCKMAEYLGIDRQIGL